MRSTLQCFVISLICSGSVFCELELYPDFQRSENSAKQWTDEKVQENEKQDSYENSARTLMYPSEYVLSQPISLPNIPARPTNPFHFKNVNYSPRLLEIAEQLKQIHRKPKFEHVNANKIINNLLYKSMGRYGFSPFFKLNMRILDDVRQNSDSIDNSASEFKENFPDDTVEVEYENSGREEEEPPLRERETSWRKDDPSEFAYLPSDPRYYQNDKNNAESKVLKETNKFAQEYGAVSLSPRSEATQEVSLKTEPEYQKVLVGSEVKMVPIDPQRLNNPTGMYLIAVVAGISAAATVGLIAFAIGWYK